MGGQESKNGSGVQGEYLGPHRPVDFACLVDAIRGGIDTSEAYLAAYRLFDCGYAAFPQVLELCVGLARKANGPIIEAGSGLTTILMAAANPQFPVYCLEHDPKYAAQTQAMARQSGVDNVQVLVQPLTNGWYSPIYLHKLPEQFPLGLIDGPPRQLGVRRIFFEHFSHTVDTIICDDAQEPGYRQQLSEWANGHQHSFELANDRAIILRSGNGKGTRISS